MSNLTSSELKKPTKWEDFERCCCELFKCILDDPNTQMNGRSGQAQNGVDVYGRRNKDSENWVGIQCKKKLDSAVTETELIAELEKAKNFKPKIKEYFLLTTAPRDAKIQEKARELTKELSQSDHAIEVIVWGWEDIHENAAKHETAWLAFDPTHDPFSKQTRDIVRGIEKRYDSHLGELALINDHVNIVSAQSSETELHGKIKGMASLIGDGEPVIALKSLKKLKDKVWSKASKSERFSLLSTIASAEHMIGNDQIAAELLSDAFAEYPEHEDAIILKSKSHFLKRHYQQSLDTSLPLLSNKKHNAEAASLVIQSRMHLDESSDATVGISDDLLEQPLVIITLIFYKRFKDDPSWMTDALDAFDKFPQNKTLLLYKAEATLEKFLQSRNGNSLSNPITSSEKQELNHAKDILLEEFNNACRIMANVPINLANNAALILRLLGRDSEAQNILEKGLKDNPNSDHLIIQRATLMREEGDFQNLLKLVPEDSKSIELSLLRAEALSASNKTANLAIDEIDIIDINSLNTQDRDYALAIKARAYVSLQKYDDAENLLDEYLKNIPDNPRLHAFKIKIYRSSNQIDKAEQYLQEAFNKIDCNQPLDTTYEFAQEAKILGRSDIAFKLLKDRVGFELLSEELITLIASAIEEKQFHYLSKLFDRLPREISCEPEVLRLKVIFGIHSGLPDVEAKINQYLKLEPYDLAMFLQYAFILQRQNRYHDIERKLEKLPTEKMAGTPSQKMDLAKFYIRSNQAHKGFSLAYETLAKNWHDEKAHLNYQAIMLSYDKISLIIPNSEIVEVDTAIKIKKEDGEEQKFYIENNQHHLWGSDHIAPEDDLAKLLIGKRLGEKISLNDGGDNDWEICYINHVWIEALHLSIGKFNSRFPKSIGFKKLTHKVGSDVPLEELESILKSDHERLKSLITIYQEQLIPFSFLSPITGQDPIDAWASMTHRNEKFKVCLGSKEERETARKILLNRNRDGFVVDAITLILIHRLDLLAPITEVCGQIFIPQSLLDLFINRELEAQHFLEKDFGTISYNNGHTYFREYSSEDRKEILRHRTKELNWIKNNCRIKPAIPQYDLDPSEMSALKRYSSYITHPALTAAGEGLLLLSEDMGYRVWARKDFNVTGTWLLPVLSLAYEEGHIQKDDYYETIINLVECGHSYISLTAEMIIYQLEKDNFVLSNKTYSTLNMIGGKAADLNTNLPIAISVVQYVLDNKIDHFLAAKIASVLFETMIDGRKNQQREIVLGFREAISRKHAYFHEHSNLWLIGHSIGLSYFQELMRNSNFIPK